MLSISEDVEQRRKKIMELIAEKGKVKVAALGKMFDISEVTIRNDLRELELEGLIKRVHGGAVGAPFINADLSFQQKLLKNIEEKKSIAIEAAKLIQEGDSIILDSGTTAVHLARELTNKKNLRVLTSSLPIANELGAVSDIDLIMLGGNYNVHYKSVGGPDAIRQLQKYRAAKLFLGADGISAESGLTTARMFEAEMCSAMMNQADEVIVIADHTKLGFTGFVTIAPITRIHVLITDSEADESELQSIRDAGTKVIVSGKN